MTRWKDAGSPDWILKALREAGGSLISEMYGLGTRGVPQPIADEVSPAQIIAHLVATERLAQEQITAILDGRPDPIPVRDVETPTDEDAPAAGLTDGLAQLEDLRAGTLRLLWSLADEDWQRLGRHPYWGEITPAQIARELAHHDLEHLWQVRRLWAHRDAAGPP